MLERARRRADTSEANQRTEPSAGCVPCVKPARARLHDPVTTARSIQRAECAATDAKRERELKRCKCPTTANGLASPPLPYASHMEPLMTDRTHDPDPARRTERDDTRTIGGVPREASHPMYPASWIPEENLRQGFSGLNDRHRSADEGGPYRSAPPSDVERSLDRGFERGRNFGPGPK